MSCSIVATQVSCNGLNDGTATVTPQGGTPGSGPAFTYSWSHAATLNSASVSGLAPGTYTVTVTDANSCTTTCEVVITEPATLSVSCYSEPAFCFGGNSFIDITTSGGTPGYIFQWSDGTTGEDIPAIGAGTYTVTVTDSNGCTATCSTEITQPSDIVITAVADSATCAGDLNGSIQTTIAGGTPCANNSRGLIISKFFANPLGNDLAQEWVELIATRNIDFSVTPYTVIVANNGTANALGWKRGSTVTYAFQITSGNAVQGGVYYVGGSSLSTSGITSNILRSINVTNTGGDGSLGSSQATAGVFGNGGTSADGIAVFQGTVATITPATTPIDAIFYGSAVGGAFVAPGTSGYALPSNDKYTGGFLQTGSFIAPDAVSGQYMQAAGSFNPILDAFVTSRVFSNSATFTPGNSLVSIVGASDPYTFVWENGATTQNRTNLDPGMYTITVTDCNGCTKEQTITVHSKLLLNGTTLSTNLSCNNNGTGTIDLTVTNGNAPFTYNWSNGSTTEDISSLSAGIYTVNVTDDAGCTLSLSTSVSEPAAISIVALADSVNCAGENTGAIDISISGGAPCGENAPAMVISKVFANPNGNDSPFEFVELFAIKDIDFSLTPFSVIFANNGNANANGWLQGGGITYGFEINSGMATAGTTYYVGGSSMIPLTNILRAINTGTTTGDNGLGVANPTGILGNGGTNADAVAVFNGSLSSLTSSTVPQDALFFGSVIGGAAMPGGTQGYELPISDHYSGGKLQNTSFLALDVKTDTIIVANGVYDLTTSSFNAPRTFTYLPVLAFTNASGISLIDADPYQFLWSNGETTENISALSAGIYTVLVTDCNGCTTTAESEVFEPVLLELVESHIDINCYNEATGSIDITVFGGTAPYTYEWSDGNTDEDIDSLVAGVYTVTVTDYNGCSYILPIEILQNPPFTIGKTIIPNMCHGDSTAQISVYINGATPPYTYQWSNGATTAINNYLTAGTYTLTVTDSLGCDTIMTFYIFEPNMLDKNFTITQPLCAGQTGSINITAFGGTPWSGAGIHAAGYDYSLDGGAVQSSGLFTGISSGTHTVLITDSNGCNLAVVFTITAPAPLICGGSVSNTMCNGGSDGMITSNITGGTAPYTYSWSTGATTQTIGGLAAGAYTVTVTDANGCTMSCTYNIVEPPAITFTLVVCDNIKCYGGNDGKACLNNVVGGTAPYTYQWNTIPAQTTANATGLTAGTWTVTITDAMGCMTTGSVTISQPSAPLALSGVVTNVGCNGGNTGAVNLTISGGTAGYTVLWSTGATTEDISGLSAGTYTVTVTDANGCTVSTNTTYTVGQSAAIALSLATNNVSCNGGGNGSITATATGGSGAYSYSWSNGASTATIINLAAGIYTVTVTDGSGCTQSTSATIIEPSALSCICNASVTNVSCFGGSNGSVTAQPIGGTPPYGFVWSNGALTQTINNLTAGTYTVTITDANGCTKGHGHGNAAITIICVC
ncbi:MAG: SprB repeat-containing protein [Bacteroidetes bacterium]|nr:SprB repeat-containing protein [Bacteroidota bacterium]